MKKVISAVLAILMMLSIISIGTHTVNAATKGWQDDVKTIGVELTDAAEFNILGHWLAKSEFVKATDWYESGKPVYMQKIAPVDNKGTMKAFDEGEAFVFNYDLYKTFTEESLTLLDEDVEVAAYLFGAEKKDGETGEFKLLNEYRGYHSNVSGIVYAPYDNFVAALVFVVEDANLAEFGAFVTMSASEYQLMPTLNDSVKADMNGFTVDLTAEDMEAVVLPYYETYAIANAKAFAMNLTGGEYYTVKLSTEDMTGFRAYFTDENGDVINQTVATGAENDKESELSIGAMIEGEYFLVVAGNNLDNRGTVKVAFEKVEVTEEIQEIDVTTATEDIVLEKGIFEVKGANNNVKLIVGNAADVVLDNATVGGIVLVNDMASAVIEAKGMNYVYAKAEGYGITNAEYATAGLYITGDAITVKSSEGAKGAILMHDAPLHLNVIKMVIKAEKVDGFYPVGIWVIGKNLPMFTIGVELLNGLKLSVMMYSEYYAYGFTIADEEAITDFTKAATDVVVSLYPIGDTDLDGTVDTKDVTTLLQYCAGMMPIFDDAQFFMSDMNNDGVVNTYDAVLILKMLAQL